MRHRFPKQLASCLGLCGLACACAQRSSWAPDDERRVLEVIRTQEDAWNRGDIEVFMEGYSRSPELSFSSASGVERGWEQVHARYKRRYPDREAMGKLEFGDLAVLPLGPDAALVTGSWRLERGDDDARGIFSLVFRREPSGWLIIHDHTSAFASGH